MASTDQQPVIERWTTGAKVYTDVVAKTTVHGTSKLADRMHNVRPFPAPSDVINVGCGTRSLTVQIHSIERSTPILATDIAKGMLEQVNHLQLSNVRTQATDGATLDGLPDDRFSHGCSSFAINFIPNPIRAVRSLYRVVKPGGVVGIVLWRDRVDWGNAVEKAAKRIKPFAWRTEEAHRAALESVGLQVVQTETVSMPLAAEGLDGAQEYAFRGGNPVMQTMMSNFVNQGGDLKELEKVYANVLEGEYREGVSADTILG